ncbi:MAG TPA: Trm112 family protein [Anaeromyxobacteraceae bacterium]|nr:Trm112 family protein [Anaeromyxobacteraceae bacterium]
MALAPELKEVLACPKCKGDVEIHEEEREIRCLRCRIAYRIEDDIPVMLVEEARPL